MIMKARLIIYTLICTVLAVSCGDITAFEDRLSKLEDKVKVLEAQLNSLNDNIDALRTIAEGGTINSVTESNGIYTITCSNGDIITINQGSVGVGNPPILSIDADGYWMADYGDGPKYILSGNEKVRALGQNGLTPVFGIDADGYWTIKIGDGAPEQVKGPDGKPVSAISDGTVVEDTFFKEVYYDKTIQRLTITLQNGDTYTVPVVSDFLCHIEGGEGPQIYKPGDRRVYSVEFIGIDQTFITTPKGWDAFLSETSQENNATLTVIAPVTVKSESTIIADSRKDIAILAISKQGYATTAKISVQLEGTEIDIKPIATVRTINSDIETIEFAVVISDATSYKYIIQEAEIEAPSADKVATEGITGDMGSNLIISGLKSDTEYTLYVLPMNGDIRGDVVSVTQRTKSAPVTDLYDAYQNKGKEIEINGIRYSKAANGEATLVTAESAEDPGFNNAIKSATGGVFFIDTPEGTEFVITKYNSVPAGVKTIIIGRDATKPAKVKQADGCIQTYGSLAVKNVRFNMSESTLNYLSVIIEGSEFIHYDGCWFDDIKKPIISAADKANIYAVSDISITNSEIRRIESTDNIAICNLNHTTSLNKYDRFRFDNNVVYCNTTATMQVFNHSGKTTDESGWEDNTISVRNNIFYNVPSYQNCYIRYHQVSELKCNKNIFIASDSHSAHWNITYCFSEKQKENPDAIDISDNLCYGLGAEYSFRGGHTSGKFYPGNNTIAKLEQSPFVSFNTKNGTYELKSEYAGYGPQQQNQ